MPVIPALRRLRQEDLVQGQPGLNKWAGLGLELITNGLEKTDYPRKQSHSQWYRTNINNPTAVSKGQGRDLGGSHWFCSGGGLSPCCQC
jgi:hypothetical protein